MNENNLENELILDGSLELQKKKIEAWLDTLTEEEKERSMSDEFAYLDED